MSTAKVTRKAKGWKEAPPFSAILLHWVLQSTKKHYMDYNNNSNNKKAMPWPQYTPRK